MKMHAAAGIYISEIYENARSCGQFHIYFEPSRAKYIMFQAKRASHQAITAMVYWLPVFKPQDKFLIKLVHSSEKKLFDIKFLT